MTHTVDGGNEISGAHEGFDEFFQRTYPRMRARALLLWRHREEAEDAVQEAYAELFRYWDRVSHYEAPEAWAYKVMTQRLNRARRTWFRQHALEIQPPPTASVEETSEARQVLAALGGLPDRQRQVLVLHCLQGMPQQEIAELLDIKRSSVAGSLRKARGRLGRELGLPVGELPGGGDALMPSAGDVRVEETGLSRDPLDSLLRQAENWLTAACGSDEAAR